MISQKNDRGVGQCPRVNINLFTVDEDYLTTLAEDIPANISTIKSSTDLKPFLEEVANRDDIKSVCSKYPKRWTFSKGAIRSTEPFQCPWQKWEACSAKNLTGREIWLTFSKCNHGLRSNTYSDLLRGVCFRDKKYNLVLHEFIEFSSKSWRSLVPLKTIDRSFSFSLGRAEQFL